MPRTVSLTALRSKRRPSCCPSKSRMSRCTGSGPTRACAASTGMDGAQMLAGRMARQVCTHRAKERAGNVVLDDRGQLRVRRDLGNQRTQEVDVLAQEVEIGIVDPAGHLLKRQIIGRGKRPLPSLSRHSVQRPHFPQKSTVYSPRPDRKRSRSPIGGACPLLRSISFIRISFYPDNASRAIDRNALPGRDVFCGTRNADDCRDTVFTSDDGTV